MQLFENEEFFKGCSGRTWVDKNSKLVYRRFEKNKKDKLENIESITNILLKSGLKLEHSIGDNFEIDSYIVAKYKYYELSELDFFEGIYSPVENLPRLISAAKLFASFQRQAININGPKEPLDYPFCNTLEWIFEKNPTAKLLGSIYEYLAMGDEIYVIEAINSKITKNIDNWRKIIKESKWGLCHGDFHSSNVIFNGNEASLLIDFGFWIQHPLIFDFAIALEFWSRDWNFNKYKLDMCKAKTFISTYIKAGGPINDFDSVMDIMPIAKLWSDTFIARKEEPPIERNLYNGFLKRTVLDKLIWVEENVTSLFEGL